MFSDQCCGSAWAESKVNDIGLGTEPGGSYSRSTVTQLTGPAQSAKARTSTSRVRQNGSSREILRT